MIKPPPTSKDTETSHKDSKEALYEINESLKSIALYFEHKLEKEKGRRA